ncbi:MAG: hypothetical protein AB8W78_01010 [Arsenophonus endosymbiont of Dermacentor nuttalli]
MQFFIFRIKRSFFTANRCFGFENLFGKGANATDPVNKQTPIGVLSNRLDYIKYYSNNSMIIKPVYYTNFRSNSGEFFLDRNFSDVMTMNNLGDGNKTLSYYKQNFIYNGNELRFYIDDSGNHIKIKYFIITHFY